MMRPSPEEAQEMADAIAAFKKALREAVAKDLRRVGFWMVRLSNRLNPPPPIRIPHWDPIDRMAVFEPASFVAIEEAPKSWRVRLHECGQIVYARTESWGGPITKPGGTCRLPRGHDGDHVPT
jgi:hypothetical protein